jgi:hypothetical protein
MLKLSVDSLDGVEDSFHELYTERDGKYELTGIEGMKTQKDIDDIKTALGKERDAHKKTKEKLQEYDDIRDLGISSNEILSKLDRVDELEAAAADKIDDDKINDMVEKRLRLKIAPIQREKDKAIRERDEVLALNEEYKQKDVVRTIHEHVQKAALEGKVVNTALEDVKMIAEKVFQVTDDGMVVTKDNAADPNTWLGDMQKSRPHWFPASTGGGANGNTNNTGGANNPFAKDTFNLTEQGRLVKESPEKARQLAKQAGTTIPGL